MKHIPLVSSFHSKFTLCQKSIVASFTCVTIQNMTNSLDLVATA